jgi:hypothetical protein
MVRELTVQAFVNTRYLNFFAGLSVAAVIIGLQVHAARAQSAPTSTTSAPSPAQTTQSSTSTAAPSTKQSAPAARPQSASTLPTTNVLAGGGRMRNPYSESPETAFIKIPVTSSGCKSALSLGKPYFVEFRSRGAASFGHTFVLHGKLGEGNRFARYQVAGLHPKGDSTQYTIGLWVPVAAETGPSDGDVDEQFMTARYCVTLTEAEYNKVAAYIKQLQGKHKTWHGTTYNCNSFGMDVAKFIGLDTPNPNASLPKDLINKLAELNKNRQRDKTAELYSSQPAAH